VDSGFLGLRETRIISLIIPLFGTYMILTLFMKTKDKEYEYNIDANKSRLSPIIAFCGLFCIIPIVVLVPQIFFWNQFSIFGLLIGLLLGTSFGGLITYFAFISARHSDFRIGLDSKYLCGKCVFFMLLGFSVFILPIIPALLWFWYPSLEPIEMFLGDIALMTYAIFFFVSMAGIFMVERRFGIRFSFGRAPSEPNSIILSK